MNLAPIPSWQELFSIFLIKKPDESSLALTWSKPNRIAGWLSKSSWSIALISLWKYKSFVSKREVVWFIPDFFCNESLQHLRITNAKIIFYKINIDFSPNIEDCNNLSKEFPPDIFIFVHYFGQFLSPIKAKEFCKKNNAWLIEDATHVLVPIKGIGDYGDFVIFSPHKHLPIPNGAVLSIKIDEKSNLSEFDKIIIDKPSTWISQLSNDPKLKNRIHKTNTLESIKWLTKRILQNIGFNKKNNIEFDEKLNSNNFQIKTCPRVSFLSKLMLPKLIDNIYNTSIIKKTNNIIWKLYFNNSNEYQKLGLNDTDTLFTDNTTPYMSIFKSEKITAKLFDKMIEDKFPVCSWPDLPPEVFLNQDRHEIANKIRNSHIYLHIHSNLNIYKLLNKYRIPLINNEEFITNTISSRIEWINYLSLIDKTNLMQSWEYGSAKSKIEKWNVKRYLFKYNEKPIAILQLL